VASKRSNEMTIEHIYARQMINTSEGDVFMIGGTTIAPRLELVGSESRTDSEDWKQDMHNHTYPGQLSDINTYDLTIERNDGRTKTA